MFHEEWFEKHKRLQDEKLSNMKKASFEVKLKDWERLRRRLTEQHRKEVEARKELKKATKRTTR
jgi:hypothetical protein